jgi:hypothetical protein
MLLTEADVEELIGTGSTSMRWEKGLLLIYRGRLIPVSNLVAPLRRVEVRLRAASSRVSGCCLLAALAEWPRLTFITLATR